MQARENLNGDRVHWTQNKGHTRLQDVDLATLPKSEWGGDKTLLTQCMHIYGAICSVSMGSVDMFDAHFSVINTEGWHGLNYPLDLEEAATGVFEVCARLHYPIRNAFWTASQNITSKNPPRCWSRPFYAVCVFAVQKRCALIEKHAGIAEASPNYSEQISPDCYW